MKRCEFCHKEFTQKNNRFCSMRCYFAYKKSLPKELKKIVCEYCKKEFMHNNIKTKYCSHLCKGRAYNQRLKLDPIRYEHNKQYGRECRINNPEREKEKGRRSYYRNKDKRRAKVLLLRKRAEEIIGNHCVLCGSKENLRFHEIHGNKHTLDTRASVIYYLDRPNDFITICSKHHTILHALARTPIKDYKMLKNLLSYLNDSK